MNWYKKSKIVHAKWADEVPSFDNTRPYNDRMESKNDHEDFTWDKIKKAVPWTIERSTFHQDTRQGIDAIITGLKSGQPISKKYVQLKMRQYANDVSMEVIKPYPPLNPNNPWTGKDIKSEADEFYCVDASGVLRIFNTTTLKTAAKEIASQLLNLNLNKPNIRNFVSTKGSAKITFDPSEQATFNQGKVQKMLVRINPKIVKPIYTIQLDELV